MLKNVGSICTPCEAGRHYDCVMLSEAKCPDCGSTDYDEGSFFGGQHYRNEKKRRGSYRCRDCGRVFKAASLKDCICVAITHPYLPRAQLAKPVITPVALPAPGASVVPQIGGFDLRAKAEAPQA